MVFSFASGMLPSGLKASGKQASVAHSALFPIGDSGEMTPKRRWLWLYSSVIVVVIGAYFPLARWMNERRIHAAIPMDEQQLLGQSQRFILYSLHPHPMELDAHELQTKPTFHGYLILGQTQINNPTTKSDLLAALYDGLGKGDFLGCFNPRHGIRAVRGNKTVDLVVCFQCLQIEIYDERGKRTVTVSSSPKTIFNRVLSEAHVTLAD
jgi:hypothetical protein